MFTICLTGYADFDWSTYLVQETCPSAREQTYDYKKKKQKTSSTRLHQILEMEKSFLIFKIK